MKTKAIVPETAWGLGRSKLSDYIELTKFRLLMLVLLTVGIGFYLSSSVSNVVLFLNTLFGVACVGSGANALNQWYERDSDARMMRTRHRPLPSGRLSSFEAFCFGLTISFLGMAYLAFTVNVLTALLGFVTWATYLFLYTPLKRKTVLNTWIGAVPGALPPLMGWTAARGTLDIEALSLFAILYLWQLPHFFAISWIYRDDYKNGGFQMLSRSDHTGQKTSYQMFLNSALLLLASLSLIFIQKTGLLYLICALGLGISFLAITTFFFRERTIVNARKVFFASIIYFPVLWVAMVLDRMTGWTLPYL
ncbi:MAG: protoheme IX farnesyltransferase [SAR324 cluster bacterium]|nr:protoheme IX farnesyltransferase [SAR324 cluster bacterium]